MTALNKSMAFRLLPSRISSTSPRHRVSFFISNTIHENRINPNVLSSSLVRNLHPANNPRNVNQYDDLWRRYSSTTKYSNESTEQEDADDEENIVEEIVEEDDSSSWMTKNIEELPKGVPDGFYIIQQYAVPNQGFENLNETSSEINSRIEVDAYNVTLPLALTLLDPETYPSLSRARKACRKGTVVVHRGPLENGTVYNRDKCIRGRVADRVFPGDVIGKQVRMGGSDFYPQAIESSPQPFDLPVIYQDDHFAIVNKPAGVVVYSNKNSNNCHGRQTIRTCLPYVLKPPKLGTIASIRRPVSVHRLDKPTSGLLLVAKTKPAMMDLSQQFVERHIQKTYTALVHGIPFESKDTAISAYQAKHDLGVDVDLDTDGWHLIDHPLDGKSAVTVWRTLKYVPSLKAQDNMITMVELKPKTGRYHQLRRHMAWVCQCPLIGDSEYGGDKDFKDNGLFLCSNQVKLRHPYYNSPDGRKEWQQSSMLDDPSLYYNSDQDLVHASASIELPSKFSSFLKREEDRFKKFHHPSQ